MKFICTELQSQVGDWKDRLHYSQSGFQNLGLLERPARGQTRIAQQETTTVSMKIPNS